MTSGSGAGSSYDLLVTSILTGQETITGERPCDAERCEMGRPLLRRAVTGMRPAIGVHESAGYRPNHPYRGRTPRGSYRIVAKRCSELPAALAVTGDEESDHDYPRHG
jgi:hypothetical protein